MRKIITVLIMLIAAAVTVSAEPKVIRESKWNDEDNTYTLMYDEDNTYGGRYYIYRHCDFYGEEAYDKMIGKDILTYWLERESNCDNIWEYTIEITTFSQEEDKFIIYVRVTRK